VWLGIGTSILLLRTRQLNCVCPKDKEYLDHKRDYQVSKHSAAWGGGRLVIGEELNDDELQ
jgi:hypothetical protein